MFYKADPRRWQPLVNFIINEFHSLDFNGESSFDATKVLSLFRAFYEGLGWKFSSWTDDVLDRYWPQIDSEHDDVSSSSVPLGCPPYDLCNLGSCICRGVPGFLGENQGTDAIYTCIYDADLTAVATQTFGAHNRGLCRGVSKMLYRLRHHGYARYISSREGARAC